MAAEFSSWQSYWYFVHSVTTEYRYVHGPGVREFLETVRLTASKRVLTLQAGSIVWRAQLGASSITVEHEDEESGVKIPLDEDAPFPPQRMKPLQDRAIEGRANPKGIPYLYVARDRETAMAEVRPWLRAQISLGEFVIQRHLKLVACSSDPSNKLLYLGEGEPGAPEREAAVWYDIDSAFSWPVTPTDDRASYVPTQMLAEVFRQAEYDGVAYRSSSGPGQNYVLFRLDDATLRSCHLFTAKSVKYDFAQSGNSYFVRDQTGP